MWANAVMVRLFHPCSVSRALSPGLASPEGFSRVRCCLQKTFSLQTRLPGVGWFPHLAMTLR